ncbi:MAG: hypothetical protein ACPHUF_10350 [Gammaproteobacteria bacterium]
MYEMADKRPPGEYRGGLMEEQFDNALYSTATPCTPYCAGGQCHP